MADGSMHDGGWVAWEDRRLPREDCPRIDDECLVTCRTTSSEIRHETDTHTVHSTVYITVTLTSAITVLSSQYSRDDSIALMTAPDYPRHAHE